MNNNRVVEIINQLDFDSFNEELNKIDKNAPDHVEKANEVMHNFVNKIIELTKNDPISVKVALLYKIGDNVISKFLLETEDEDYLRAAVLLKYLNGYKPDLLRNDLELVNTIASFQIIQKGSRNIEIENSNKILKILSDYLNKMDMETILKQLEIDLKAFVMGLKDVHEVIFNNDDNDFKSKIIDSLFLNDYLTLDELNYIFSEIVLKNKLLRNYDFTTVIEERPQYLVVIKGLYRKICRETMDFIFSNIDEDDYEDYDGLLRDIIRLNKDDVEGLKWFFREVDKRIIKNPAFYQYMQKQEYYRMFNEVDIERVYNNNLIRFLNNNSNIDESVIETIGTYKGFLDYFDDLLDLFINSKDDNYKSKLMIPLIVSLIEKQKRKYNLDFTVVFSSTVLNDATLGFYNREKNIMYINPNMFKLIDNLDVAFVHAVDTVYHETRHANQYKEVETSNEFDFNNLIIAMDYYLTSNDSTYYLPNYEHLSFERDARDVAYVDTMSFFAGYPDIQKLVKKHREGDYHLSDYIRKEKFFGMDNYYGLVYLFMDHVVSALKVAKEKPELREYVLEKINKYPVIFKFFEIDFEKYTINVYDGEYYKKLLEESNGTEKGKMVKYSIEAFLYALRIGRYLKERSFEGIKSEDGYNAGIIKEIDENVRKGNLR